MKKFEILERIKQELPKTSMVADVCFEGANIVIYTKSRTFLKKSRDTAKEIVSKVKKRIEIRADESLLMHEAEAKEFIKKLIPSEAGISEIWFDSKRSLTLIEADKPGLVIGKDGKILETIMNETCWIPKIRRSPAIKSELINSIRRTIFENSDYRRKFMNQIGEKIYSGWDKTKPYWIRISCLGGAREVGRSCYLLQTPESRVLIDCGVNVASDEPSIAYPHLEAPEFDISSLDAVIISHAHLDHSGFLPYLYKYGYKGPVYCTEPTRDIMALLQLDSIDIAQKEVKKTLFTSKEIREMIKHTITLNYGEVTDITPDMRITLHDSGHILGSSMVHFNIGDGYHNFMYTSDFKYINSRMLGKAETEFQRLETIMIESTYGGKGNVQPSREDCEKEIVEIVKKTVARGGKILIPVLGVGRAQEVMFVLEDMIRDGQIPEIPVYIDGMVWHVTAINTTYPEFMNREVRNSIFKEGRNPLLSGVFKEVGSQKERIQLIEEKGPCVILATSGMLSGGPSVEYFKRMAEDRRNSIVFVSYQGEGTLGRRVQKGETRLPISSDNRTNVFEVKMEVYSIEGLSGHADRRELMNYISNLNPRPKRVIINHGESSRCLDLASSIHKNFRVETTAPRNLDAIRIR
ncbi:MAG: beta-CASP ribonuclease aCPSF1 [Candidatus Nanoarchaeia archaeon]|nr:beta-CASP ribonuclease aCPSF1 [Candidatus Nanoarchaeia archaeon]